MGVSSESQSYTNFVYFQEFHTVFVGNQPECDVSAYRRADADGAVAENSRCCDLFRGEGRKRSQPVPRGADFAVRGCCGCMAGVCDGQERLRFAKGGVHFALRGLRVYSNRKRFQVSGRSLRRARTKRSGLRASAAGRLRPARHLWCRFFPRFSCAPPSILELACMA